MADENPFKVSEQTASDGYCGTVGIEYVSDKPGEVVLALDVTERHTSFTGSCHGGILFGIADSAFGLCCNRDNVLSVALDAMVTYTAPVWPGDRLTVVCREVTNTKRIRTYRADVTRGDGEIVATFAATAFVTARATLDAASTDCK
jgi:acyl-CoA thioesterase